MTEKLYYEDAYKKEFTATVLDCREGKKGYEVVLSATAFYPEGGGQPFDMGILCPVGNDEGQEIVHVLEVHEKNGELLHYTDALLAVGVQVCGKIDWARRFDLMQQHSGEHIVSGLVHAAYGYDNVGFHMGSETITIDFNGELDEAAMHEIEAKANEVIWQNQKTLIFYPSPDELSVLSYRSKKELSGAVRIVEFPAAEGLPCVDRCACCGTHVAFAGEIGMIKLLSVVKFREGVRMEMISGKRVLDYLNRINEQNHQISVMLSAKPYHTAEAVRRSMDESFQLKGRVLTLEEKLFAQEAQRLTDAGNVLLFEKGLDSDSVRKLAVAVMEVCGGRCAVFSDNKDGTFKYAIGEKDGDLRALVKEMNQALNGRGGGKPFFAQGSVKSSENEIREFFESCQ
ncbi:MAG: alanine--tRNA ligase-related protein [Lachnospiraceae bacterium]|nr:alanine--tRNA ligase-related protein [Lachnospiraceae bacterium]